MTALALIAFSAGIVNGFLGTGGGILLMAALALTDIDMRDRFATVIAVILPLSAVSLISYRFDADMPLVAPYILPGVLGGTVGAMLLDSLSVKLVKRLFSLMLIWAGWNFIR